MYIRVVYTKKSFDYVPAGLLDLLIVLEEITHFYRPSEKRWISVKFDRLRGSGGRYLGPERRIVRRKPQMMEEKGTGECGPRWLNSLWRHIGTA